MNPGTPQNELVVRSYAKLNLFLRVLQRRDDGFHDIETIFQSVSLFDELRLASAPEFSLHVEGADTGPSETNLVYRAAEALRVQCGVSGGARMTLRKNIPVAAGLAGGSGNAAAALVGLKRLWNCSVDSESLHRIALQLGSDVPFCLEGGAAVATGQGERLTPLGDTPAPWFVAVHPPIAVSTPWVYGNPNLTREPTPEAGTYSEPLRASIEALRKGDWPNVVYNAMEGPVFGAYPQLAGWKQDLLDRGCAAALMSGSGPTLFGVCDSEETARMVADSFAGAVPTSVMRPVPYGVAVL